MYIQGIFGPLAQLVEQFPFKEWVAGSSPARLTIVRPVVQLDRTSVCGTEGHRFESCPVYQLCNFSIARLMCRLPLPSSPAMKKMGNGLILQVSQICVYTSP